MFSAILISPTSDRCQLLKAIALETDRLMIARIQEEYPQGFELVHLLHVAEPEVVLLDLHKQEAALKCAVTIGKHCPRTPVIGITETPSLFENAGYINVQTILPFPPTAEELTECVDELVREAMGEAKESLWAFLPAKAGSGATTVAWNTAAAVSEIPGRRVLLVECDFRSGVLSFMLNQKSEISVQDVLRASHELDGFRLEQAVVEEGDVEVLLSDRTSPELPPGWEEFSRLVGVATSRYDPVIVDLPETLTLGMRELVRRAGKIFVVAEPDLTALKLAERICNELIRLRIPDSRVSLLLNRWQEGDLGPEEVQDVLHRPVAHVFPSDHRALRTAVLTGEGLAPETELWRSHQKFAAKLTRTAVPPPVERIRTKLKSLLQFEVRR